MQTSIQLLNASTSEWSINVTDVTSGQSFQRNVTYVSSQLSAEWIVERPTVNRVLSSLANFGNVTFTECTTTIGSTTGALGAFPSNEVVMFSSASGGGGSFALTDVSGLDADGGGFTVSFLASG